MSIRAVVWDVDDTLFDYKGADRVGMGLHLAAEGLLEGYTSVEQAITRWRAVTDAQWARFSAGEFDFQGQRRERVRVFLGEELTDAAADAWFQRYIAHYETAWALFPDVLPALDALAASHRHAVLSNSSIHVQDHKLRVLGVHDRFEVILCAAELGVSKPEAGCLPRGLRRPGASPVPGGVRRGPSGDRRPGRRRGRTAVGLDRPGRRCARPGPRARGTAPHRLARRTPRDPRRGYPFWSPVHLRVMFFLRRRGAGRKAGNRRSELEQDPLRGLRSSGLWCNWQHD